MPRSKTSQYGKNLERTRVAGQGLSRIIHFLNRVIRLSGYRHAVQCGKRSLCVPSEEVFYANHQPADATYRMDAIGPISIAGSQSSILQQRDGTTSTLTPLGEREAIYSDAHGSKGITHLGFGLPSHTFSSPHGGVTGSVTPFGTPTPPNLITPAPVLPLQPKGMATPYSQPPASSGGPGGYSGFGRRSGR